MQMSCLEYIFNHHCFHEIEGKKKSEPKMAQTWNEEHLNIRKWRTYEEH